MRETKVIGAKKIDQFKIDLSRSGVAATDSYSKTFLLRQNSMDLMRNHTLWPQIENRLIERGVLPSSEQRAARKAKAAENARAREAKASEANNLWCSGEKAQAAIIAALDTEVLAEVQPYELREAAQKIRAIADEARIDDQAGKHELPSYINRAAYDLFPEVVGYNSWAEFNVPDDQYFRAAISGMADPKRCHPDFLRRAITALKANAENNGMVWEKYQADGSLDYGDIRSAMTSHHRHAKTDYDWLLRSGMSKDEARAAIQDSSDNQ